MYNTKIGKSILTLRKRAGFTQKELAERIGVTDKAVSKWERGLSYPDMSYLNQLSILLDTDADSLLTDEKKHLSTKYIGVIYLQNNVELSFKSSINGIPLLYLLLSYFFLVNVNNIIIVSSSTNIKSAEALLKKLTSYINIDIKFLNIKKIKYKEFINETLKKTESIMLIDDYFFVFGAALTYTLQKAMLIKDKNVNFHNPDIPIKFINNNNINKYYTINFYNGYIYKKIKNKKDIMELNKFVKLLGNYSYNRIYDIWDIARNRDLLK